MSTDSQDVYTVNDGDKPRTQGVSEGTVVPLRAVPSAAPMSELDDAWATMPEGVVDVSGGAVTDAVVDHEGTRRGDRATAYSTPARPAGAVFPPAPPRRRAAVPGAERPAVPAARRAVPAPVQNAVPTVVPDAVPARVQDAVPTVVPGVVPDAVPTVVPDGGPGDQAGVPEIDLSGRSLPPEESAEVSRRAAAVGGAAVRGAARVVNLRTAGRVTAAAGRGTELAAARLVAYRRGLDRPTLREEEPGTFEAMVTIRRRVTDIVGAALAAGAATTAWIDPWWLAYPGSVGLAAAIFSGRQGRQLLADTPRILAPVALVPEAGLIQRACANANLGSKDPDAYELLTPVQKDGDGWEVTLRLPEGVPFTSIKDRVSTMSATLRCTAAQIYAEGVATDDNQMKLWVANRPVLDEQLCSPLLRAVNGLDLWNEGIPLGRDARARPQHPRVVDASILIGGATRAGKTVLMRSIAAAVALDVRARLRVFDGKGSGDYNPLSRVASTFVKLDPARLVAHLRVLEAERQRRSELLDELHKAKMDRGIYEKVFPLDVTIIDELATYTLDPQWGEEIQRLLVPLCSMGANVGILIVAGTQTPLVKVIPTLVANNMQLRVAFRCKTTTSSNAILGNGRAGDGYNAVDIGVTQRGVCWIDADGAEPILMKAYYITDEELEQIAANTLRLRDAAQMLPHQDWDPVETELLRLTGVSAAAGGPKNTGRLPATDPTKVTAPDLLGYSAITEEAPEIVNHMAEVMDGDDTWTQDILARLASEYPELYQGLTANDLADQVRNHLPSPKQIARTNAAGKRLNRNGYMWEWVDRATTSRTVDDAEFDRVRRLESEPELVGAGV